MYDRGDADERPRPIVQAESRAYWEGARLGRLVLKRCDDCGTWVHPPTQFTCPSCRSADLSDARASGEGTVFTFSVMHQRGVPGFESSLPYAVALVELGEQPGLLTVGHVVDCPVEELRVGLEVRVAFEDLGDVVLPQWRRARP